MKDFTNITDLKENLTATSPESDAVTRKSSDKLLENTEMSSSIRESSTCPSKVKYDRSTRRNSRSLSSSTSRHDKRKKSSHKHRKSSRKHKSSRRDDRSRSRSRRRSSSSSSYDRHRKHESSKRSHKHSNNYKNRHSRRRDDSIESTRSITDKRKNYYEERRRARERSRSNSALRIMKMKNLDNACGYYQRYYQRPHEDNDPKKNQLYWDGYQWVIRPSSLLQQDFDVIKPGRKVIIANVPLKIHILINDLKEFLINKIVEKNVVSKSEVKDINNIIRAIELDYEKDVAIVAMESTELAKRMALLDGTILLGHTLRISLYQDVKEDDVSCSNIARASALANSAQLSAKSAALAWAAFQNFSKDEVININSEANLGQISTRVVKIFGLMDPKDAEKAKKSKLTELHEDMLEEFKKFGKIVSSIVITPELAKIGAECGSIFIEYDSSRSAEISVKSIKGRRYEGKALKTAYIQESVYINEIKLH